MPPNNIVKQQQDNKRRRERSKRKKSTDIERLYFCNFPNCSKGYGLLSHLNDHVRIQNHGEKRTPEEFQQVRTDLKKSHKNINRTHERNSILGLTAKMKDELEIKMYSPGKINSSPTHRLKTDNIPQLQSPITKKYQSSILSPILPPLKPHLSASIPSFPFPGHSPLERPGLGIIPNPFQPQIVFIPVIPTDTTVIGIPNQYGAQYFANNEINNNSRNIPKIVYSPNTLNRLQHAPPNTRIFNNNENNGITNSNNEPQRNNHNQGQFRENS